MSPSDSQPSREARGSAPITGWVENQEGATLVDLTTGRIGGDLDWIVSPEHDLAACLFPINPSFTTNCPGESSCSLSATFAA